MNTRASVGIDCARKRLRAGEPRFKRDTEQAIGRTVLFTELYELLARGLLAEVIGTRVA